MKSLYEHLNGNYIKVIDVQAPALVSAETNYEIDIRANKDYDLLVKQHVKQQGVTEQLKTENQILWVQMMNNISQQVKEVVYNDLVYII